MNVYKIITFCVHEKNKRDFSIMDHQKKCQQVWEVNVDVIQELVFITGYKYSV